NLKQAKLDKITDGRVFTAPKALQLGLVDAIGHVPDAIEAAKQSAGVDQARVIRYYTGSSPPQSLYANSTIGLTQPTATQINILPINLPFDAFAEPRMLYLWKAARP